MKNERKDVYLLNISNNIILNKLFFFYYLVFLKEIVSHVIQFNFFNI